MEVVDAKGPVRPRETRWKFLLLALCGVEFLNVVAVAADQFGLGGPPWTGFGDHHPTATARAYVFREAGVVPGGAAWNAGLRDGDLVDIREQGFDARFRFVTTAWLATRTTPLIAHRGDRTFTAALLGTAPWQGPWLYKLPQMLIFLLAYVVFLCCGLLIASRRSQEPEARILVLVLLLLIATSANPNATVTPSANVGLVQLVASAAFGALGLVLLTALSSRFGVRSAGRRILEWAAYGINAISLMGSIAAAFGILTLSIDPWPYLDSPLWSLIADSATIIVVVVAAAAVPSSPSSERPRTAWLLLPLPVAVAFSAVALNFYGFTDSWYVFFTMEAVSGVLLLFGAVVVSYALLNRRVFDLGFVLNRTVVVAAVSLVVVAAFVLLEWALGFVLTSWSHITGLVANAALALGLGLSLRSIHRRVDAFVDRWMFRQRYENERALRDYSAEAAYATEADPLLDETIAKIQNHTDARAAAVFVDEGGVYRSVRRFGDATIEVAENDPAVLALKTWHQPIDPHRYTTALHGDLAIPMIVRGQLLGFILCGERAGGEAYAPDEVAVLAEFARGIGAALDGLNGASARKHPALLSEISQSVDALRESLSRIELRLSERSP